LRALRAQSIAETVQDIKEVEELAGSIAQQAEESRLEKQRLLDAKR